MAPIWINIVGTLAACCSMSSFAPQIAKILRERDTTSISLRTYAVTVGGFALWTAYGLMIRSWPVAGSNLICLILSATILALRIRLGG